MYFISVGYGLAMVAQALATLWLQQSVLDLPATLHCALMAAYGVRLAAFILWRNTLPSYQAKLAQIGQRTGRLSAAAKAGMWAACSGLYVAMFAPAIYDSLGSASGGQSANLLANLGLALGALGVVWEAVADAQQQLHYEAQAKPACTSKTAKGAALPPDAVAAHNDQGDVRQQLSASGAARLPCMQGLFRLSRHANYFGELMVWWGSYVAGSRAYHTPTDWLVAALGTAFITLIIISESKSRDQSQQERYGGNAVWLQYKTRTGRLLPHLLRGKSSSHRA